MIEPVKNNVIQFPKEKQRPITAMISYIPAGILNLGPRIILHILASYANKDDIAWPSQDTLARDYYGELPEEDPKRKKEHRKQIRIFLKDLKDKKLIFVQKKGRSNQYIINRSMFVMYRETLNKMIELQNFAEESDFNTGV
jgi:hypothetical protein